MGDAPAPVDPAMLAAASRGRGGAGGIVRRGALRALLVGLACAFAGLVLAGLFRRGGDAARTIALFGLFLGLVAGAAGSAEAPIAVAASSRRGHLLGALFVAVGAALGAALALAQAAYVVALIEEAEVEAALKEAMRLLAKVVQDPAEAAALFGGFGLLLGANVFARLRGLGLLGQLGVSLLAFALLVTPAVALAFASWDRDRPVVLGLCGALALAAPLLARLADAVERKVWPPAKDL